MSAKINSLLAILLNDDEEEEYADGYKKLTLQLKKERNDELIKDIGSDLVEVLKRDFKSDSSDISNSALLFFSQIIEHVTTDFESNEQLSAMLLGLLTSKASVESLKACFTAISEHRHSQPYLKIAQIICDCTYKDGAKTMIPDVQKTVILEYFSILISNKENSSFIKTEYVKVLLILLAFTVDGSDIVRKNAIDTAEKFLISHPTNPSHIATIASYLKQHTMKRLKEVYSESSEKLLEVLVHQCPLILKIMGPSIKKSSSVINALLSVVEQGFRHPKSEIKTASFKAWDCLINCFAADLEVLSSARYMKLLMQPLTATQSSDALNITRIETLWSLARKLKSKLPALFTTVCLPIIHSCLGNLDPDRLTRRPADKIPIKSRLSGAGLSCNTGDNFYAALQASGYRATPKKASKNRQLQLIGVELLIHMLQPVEKDDASQNVIEKFRMLPLNCPLLSTVTSFVSHSQLLITAVSEVLCHLTDISSDVALIMWNRLLSHVKLHLETNLKKKKRETELFNFFLQTLQNIVDTQSVPASLKFRFINSFLELPDGILSSTFYGGSLNGMHGVPVLGLLRLLFDRCLICTLIPEFSEDIETCANKLISCGFENKIRILSFCQSVVEILQSFVNVLQNTRFEKLPDVSGITNLLLKIWSQLGKNLNQHILKSQEVNQGDNLDHDFSAMYAFLLFPISLKPTNSNFLETWIIVYKTFLWCVGFVTTCKPNEVCDHFSSALLKEYSYELPESCAVIFADICNCMINNAEFDHEGFVKQNRMSYVEAAASPGACSVPLPDLDKHKNLRKFSALVRELFSYKSQPITELVMHLLPSLIQLFKSIHHYADVRSLFSYFAPTLKLVLENKDLGNKTARDVIEEVMTSSGISFAEKDITIEILTSLFTDANVLDFFSSCFKTKDRKVKNILVEFWRQVVVDTSIHNQICEVLSDEFKSNLFFVYKQMGWDCPWKDIELPNSIEPVLSGPSQDENYTQSSIPPVSGYGAFGSPIKKHSFLSPKKSPLRSSSPVKTPLKTPTRVKRKLGNLGAEDGVTYVKCNSPYPKPSTPLTEHQKEKKRQRGFIPAMYNNLDETQENEIVSQENVINVVDEKTNKIKSQEEENHPDIIKASQTDEGMKTKKQKQNEPKEKPKINLKRMTSLQEEDEPVRRSRRLQTRQSIDQKIQMKDDDEIQDEDVEIVSSDNDSLTGKTAKEINETSNMDTTVASEESDVSYEYVEIADASTNQTHADISVDDEITDVSKDLGVTPLDESYEYVAVADMSVNVNASNKSICQNNVSISSSEVSDNGERTEAETTKDVSSDDLMTDTDARSEYEAVAMADMSTNPANLTADDHKSDDSSSNEIDVVETNEKNNIAKNDDKASKPLRRSLRNQQKEEDMDDYISSDGEGEEDVSFEIDDQNHKSLNETEYEYVEVADTSAYVVNDESIMETDNQENDVAEQSHEEDDDNLEDEDVNDSVFTETDASVCVITDDDDNMDETNVEDEFIDARSSLGGEVSVLNESKTLDDTDVVNISGESSVSGDLFETSVESDGKSDANEKSVIFLEISESEEDQEKISNKENLGNNLPKMIIKPKKPVPILQTISESSEPPEEETKDSAEEQNNTSPPSKALLKFPALTALQNQTSCQSEESPSAKSILKRRVTIGPISFQTQSPNNRRRVSFAEPISKSKRVENTIESFQQSPRSSLIHLKKHSPRTVNRRLSLQPEKKKNTEVEMSPLSLRSVRVAQAIANIKAKDPSSPSTLSRKVLKMTGDPSSTPDIEIRNLSLKDLEDSNLINRLSKSQVNKLISFLLKTTTKLHNSVMEDACAKD